MVLVVTGRISVSQPGKTKEASPNRGRSGVSGDAATESVKRPSRAKLWFAEIRPPFLTASIVPVVLGATVAWAESHIFLWDFFLLSVIAGCCLHIAANVANDYFDHLSGTDDMNVEFVRPFTGGSRMIQRGFLSPSEVLAESMVFFMIGGLIGLYLAVTRGMIIIVLGLAGAASGFFYTAPPVRLVSRGVGEVFIGLNFGILMTLGGYYVQTQTLSLVPIAPSIPVALLITAVLYINEFPDYRADEAASKRTLVVRLGRRRAAKGYAVIMTAVYFSIVLPAMAGWMTLYSLIALSTLPLSALAVRQALASYEKSFELVPANASTVLSHLLTGMFLTLGYVLDGFALPASWTLVVSIVLLVVTLMLSAKIHRQKAPPEEV